ncbi:MAG: 4-hydroxy-tetrahydrodipicolinate synthase [Myxococcota bacterium]|jgi:4-hydroxy-tetrahydrodipicolinate synthase
MTFRLEGTMTALVTPMRDDADRSLDLPALARLVEQQIAGGIEGLVACGTTGEAVTLSDEEYALVVGGVVKLAHGRVPVVAGAGSNSTAKTIANARLAESLGVDALLVVTPYYNKPTQAGLLAHFRAVADAVKTPIILYNVPGRTGCNLLPATAAELAKDPRFVGVKEASGSLDQVQEIVGRVAALGREDFGVVSGEDGLNVPIYSVGGRGAISVASNPAPTLTTALYRLFRAGRTAEAGRGQVALHGFIKTLFSEPNPQPAKMAMHLLGLMEPVTRLPLLTALPATTEQLRKDMKALGLLA